MTATLFDQLGGEPALRRIIQRFVDRLFADVMIGFFFARVDRARLREKEFEFAAAHLGAPVEYTGRALPQAHRGHRIFDGQFARRRTILKETLVECGVPEAVREHWLLHVDTLKDQIVLGPCQPETSDGKS
jgi:hemoglobin